MDLKEFLLMIFDKETDRYPIIRESFLRSWDSSEVLDILATTNYRCTRNELRKYISHDCIDKGIKVLSMCNIPRFNKNNYSIDMLLDTSYTRLSILAIIGSQFHSWLTSIHTTSPAIVTLFTITTSNSEFTFSMVISASIDGLFGIRSGSMSITSEITSKINTSAVVENVTRLYPEDSISIPMSDEDVLITEEEITEFCNIITMPLEEVTVLFMNEFNNSKNYPYTYKDVLDGEY